MHAIVNERELLAHVRTDLPTVRHLLAFAPHPDDEVFGCGGLLARMADTGIQLTVVVATDGSAGGDDADGDLIETRASESRAAARVLGIPEPIFWGMPDRGLIYGEALIERIMAAITATEADCVLLPSPIEVHPDHQALSLAGAEALRRLGGDRQIIFYEVNTPLQNPNLLLDISALLDKKRAAMHCFVSQLAELPYDSRMEGLSRFRSYFLGPQAVAAEAFMATTPAAIAVGLFPLFNGVPAHRQRLGFAADIGDLPLVSIIVRSMDRPTLARALDSLALQTWSNVEVVVVNAKGGQHSLLAEQCGSFPLRLVNQGGSPLGRSQAANAGLDACRGGYVGFLDDDDTIDPDHIHCLVKVVQKQPVPSVAYAGVRGIDASSGHAIEFREPGVTFARLLMGNIIPIHAVLFPSCLLKRGACFDESLDIYEDWDFWLQLARQAPFILSDRVSATYYTGGSSAVSPLACDPETVLKANLTVFAKWLPQLSAVEFKSVTDLYYRIVSSRKMAQDEAAATFSRLQETETRLQETETRLQETDLRLFYALTDAVTLRESTSWKITQPLRTCSTAISAFARWCWRMVPLSFQHKQSLKQFLFSVLPVLSRLKNSSQADTVLLMDTEELPVDENDILAGNPVPYLQTQTPGQLPVKLIAFYLPQFHAIPENDAWWGEGFTEWTNVRPAQPQFAGHHQPHLPGELGYYNLLEPATQLRQVELAKRYGIGGFCFYFYWFGGTRLLEGPTENYLKNRDLDLPFCLCWANENWSRRWDGLDKEILIAQNHSPEDDLAFIAHVAHYMHDIRYIRIEGKPLLIVYRPDLLPSAKATAGRWRNWCRNNGMGDIYLATTQSFDEVSPYTYGFDAAIEFPPNNTSPPDITAQVRPVGDDFRCNIYDWRVFIKRSRSYKKPGYPLFRTVCPSWDNTPRRKNNSTVLLNSSPRGYQEWLYNAIGDTCSRFTSSDQRLVFINAWNEWAEGAYLEPDQRHGYAWLEASRMALVRLKLLQERHPINPSRPVALVMHIYYIDLFEELLTYVGRIEKLQCKLYITCPPEHTDRIADRLAAGGYLFSLLPLPNRGRDVLPFLKIMPQVLEQGHDLLIKVHTKRSTHRQDGDVWRRDLYDKLLSEPGILGALEHFKQNPEAVLLGPEGHIVPMSFYFGSNARRVEQLAARLGILPAVWKQLEFVAGTMFFARPEALMPLMGLAIGEDEFEEEAGQTDGTMAHAIERVIAISAFAASNCSQLSSYQGRSLEYQFAARG